MGGSKKNREPETGLHSQEDEASPPYLDRASPGLEGFLSGLREGRDHSVLDLGPSVESNFRLYSRFARQIRFADFLTHPPRGAAFAAALQSLDPPPGRVFDLVLVWNFLDLLVPDERERLINRLDQITGWGSRLFVVVDSSGAEVTQPQRFTVLNPGRLRQEPIGHLQALRFPLLPAEVMRVLSPFEVLHAYTLRHGLREYIGAKGGGGIR